ncbi:MAG: 2Fe-2S iron-sulfur cluster binding domain-containing protein [Chitinispirillaceae bacterium]|nr:2Fe-2S iron-sulfur cluster binding domain-containing protein [Chitinispirillaceae bacterium]
MAANGNGIVASILFLVVCGGVLALLLVLAERYILNFGPCTIDINDGEKKVTVNGGGSLLSLLASQDIFIPSACGGRGSCAYCKVTVTAGAGEIGPVEEPYLSAGERAGGTRLSCQVKVRGDVAIRIPREYFSVRRYRGRLLVKKPMTHDIVELRIELLEPPEIEFIAGQYAQLESKEYKGREAVMRAYSISSPPSDKRHVEFMVRLVPGGICTTWVFEHLREGQEVRLSGPYGEFHLRPTEAPLLFIAGGSGMAPIWSILRNMKETKSTRHARYFFGAQTQADLFLVNELRELQRAMPSFAFIPALSNEPEGSGWTGEKGLITDVVSRHVRDASQHEAYLCGSPGMINACVNVLKTAGMPESKIYFDKFA